MGRMSLLGMKEMMDNEDALLEWHLRHNHYPPHPLALVATAKEALAKCRAGELDSCVELPRGIQWKDGSTWVKASTLVKSFHLEDFLEQNEE